jgi:hypothetical protein
MRDHRDSVEVDPGVIAVSAMDCGVGDEMGREAIAEGTVYWWTKKDPMLIRVGKMV